MSQYAARIEQAMKSSKVTVRDLAQAMKITESHVNRYLRGDVKPGIERFHQMARMFRRPMEWFLGDEVTTDYETGLTEDERFVLQGYREARASGLTATAAVVRLNSPLAAPLDPPAK